MNVKRKGVGSAVSRAGEVRWLERSSKGRRPDRVSPTLAPEYTENEPNFLILLHLKQVLRDPSLDDVHDPLQPTLCLGPALIFRCTASLYTDLHAGRLIAPSCLCHHVPTLAYYSPLNYFSFVYNHQSLS